MQGYNYHRFAFNKHYSIVTLLDLTCEFTLLSKKAMGTLAAHTVFFMVIAHPAILTEVLMFLVGAQAVI